MWSIPWIVNPGGLALQILVDACRCGIYLHAIQPPIMPRRASLATTKLSSLSAHLLPEEAAVAAQLSLLLELMTRRYVCVAGVGRVKRIIQFFGGFQL